MTSVSVKDFLTYAVHTSDYVKESSRKSCSAWIESAQLFSFWYINEPQCL